jgi:L-aminopeptidase/D-esterase-like protein
MKLLQVLLGVATLATVANAQAPRADTASKGLTDVPGILVGHHTLAERPTGCTVILAEGNGPVWRSAVARPGPARRHCSIP